MKKLLYLCLVLGLCSCTNVDKNFNEILKNIDLEQKTNNSTLPREMINLDENSAQMILADITNRLRNNQTQNYFEDVRTSYNVYLGNELIIPLINGENNVNVLNSPKDMNYDIAVIGNRMTFRSLYQGIYEVAIYSNNILTRKIKIKNILKYDFSELKSYQMIINAYNADDLKALSDNISLHRIAYPESFRDKDISFMMINLALKDGNTRIIRDEIALLGKTTSLNDYDKAQIIMALETLEGKDYVIPEDMLNYAIQSQAINDKVASLILVKENITTDEAMFLENIFNYSGEKRNIAEKLSSWYNSNGNAIKGQEYLEKLNNLGFEMNVDTNANENPTNNLAMLEEQNKSQFEEFLNVAHAHMASGNYVESIMFYEKALEIDRNYKETSSIYYDMGIAYGKLNNNEKGVEFLKKSLNLEKNDDKKAKIYYNIGMLYKALGDEEQSRNYFTYVIQNYPTSKWSIRSRMNVLD